MLRPRISRALIVAISLAACDRPTDSPAAPATGVGTVAFVNSARDRIRDAIAAGKNERLDPRLNEAEKLLATQRWRVARDLLEKIRADDPTLLQPVFYVALTHHKERRYAEALPLYEQVLAARPAFPNAYQVLYFYGWALFYLGRIDVARAAFAATLELNPAKYDANYGLAQCDAEDGRVDDAMRRLGEVIAAATDAGRAGDRGATQDIAKSHARLADLLEAKDDLASARSHYQQCVQLDPTAYEAWFRLSKVLDRLGDSRAADEARAAADRARAAADEKRRSRP